MTEMTTRQRITLAEFLGSHFLKVRAEKLNAEALDEMTVGERYAARFGGQVAGWVSLPNPPKRAAVSNKLAFLAWVRKYMPDEIETVEIVRPGTQASLLAAAKASGGKWLNKETGKYVDIEGITFGVGDPSPRVELTDEAAEAIGAAWRAGEIDLTPMLALPVPVSDEPGSATDAQVGKLVTVCQSKFQYKLAERAQMVATLGQIVRRDLGGDLASLSEAEAAKLLDTLEGTGDRAQLDALLAPAAAPGGDEA
jgi:hypothetical protein